MSPSETNISIVQSPESSFDDLFPQCFERRCETLLLAAGRLIAACIYLFRLKADGEGTYQCTETGLIFEVTRKVDIKYCILSWSKYADLVVKPWVVGGPLFDVNCEPGGLSSIQFPHSLCLGSKYLALLRGSVVVCTCEGEQL